MAYEFGKTQTQIFALVKAFFFSLVVGISIIVIVQVRKTKTKDTELQKRDIITLLSLLSTLPFWIGILSDSIIEIFYAHIKFSPLINAFSFNYISPISASILCVLLAIKSNNNRKKWISKSKDKQVEGTRKNYILRLWPSINLFLLIVFIVGAIFSILVTLVQYLHLFGVIGQVTTLGDLFKFIIQIGKSIIDSIRDVILRK